MARAVERVARNGVGLIPSDGVQVKRDDDAMAASLTGLDQKRLEFSTQSVAVDVPVDIFKSCMFWLSVRDREHVALRSWSAGQSAVTLVQLHCVTLHPDGCTSRRISAVCGVRPCLLLTQITPSICQGSDKVTKMCFLHLPSRPATSLLHTCTRA